MIENIAIMHSELQGGEYRLLADLFRFSGITVFNYAIPVTKDGGKEKLPDAITDKEKLNAELDQDLKVREAFDIVIYIEPDSSVGKNWMEAIKERYKSHIADPSSLKIIQASIDWNAASIVSNAQRIQFLKDCINDCFESQDVGALTSIAEVMIYNELIQYRIAFTHLVSDGAIVRVVRKYFLRAYADIMSQLKNNIELLYSYYYCFFSSVLTKYINETCMYLGQRLMFNLDQQVERLEQILTIFKLEEEKRRFAASSVEMLIAYCYECDRGSALQSQKHFMLAVEKLKGSVQACYPHYRLGRIYEKKLNEPEMAIAEYEAAYELDHREYRAVYKQADFFLKQKPRKCLDSFKKHYESVKIFQEKAHFNLLQPKEYEYLYKAWYYMDYLYAIKPANVEYPVSREEIKRQLSDVLEKARGIDQKNQLIQQIFGKTMEIDIRDDEKEPPRKNICELIGPRIKEVCPV